MTDLATLKATARLKGYWPDIAPWVEKFASVAAETYRLREAVSSLTQERDELRAELERLKPFFGQEGFAIVRRTEAAERQRDEAIALLRAARGDDTSKDWETARNEIEEYLFRPDIAALIPKETDWGKPVGKEEW